jgi:valyl-tRNA synthetase
MREITATIGEDGAMTLDTKGFKGKACQEATDKILKELEVLGIGVEVKDDKKKAEYYETETASRTGQRV